MRQILEAVADALEYPVAGTAQRLRATAAGPVAEAAGIGSALLELACWLEAQPPGGAEEAYTRLFDLSPVCTLNLGYHLFGDSYERGALLAGLSAEHARAGLDLGDELPDYLPHLLRLHGTVKAEEDLSLFTELVLKPGLGRMRSVVSRSTDPWSRLINELAEFLGVPADATDEAGAAGVAGAAEATEPSAACASCAAPPASAPTSSGSTRRASAAPPTVDCRLSTVDSRLRQEGGLDSTITGGADA